MCVRNPARQGDRGVSEHHQVMQALSVPLSLRTHGGNSHPQFADQETEAQRGCTEGSRAPRGGKAGLGSERWPPL